MIAAEGAEGYVPTLAADGKSINAELTSSFEQPQASFAIHDLEAKAGDTLTIDVAGKLKLGDVTDSATTKITISMPADKRWELSVDREKVTIDSSQLSVRLVAVRRYHSNPENEQEKYSWYELLILFRGDKGSWQQHSELEWFYKDKANEKAVLTTKVEAQGKYTRCSHGTSSALQVSAASEGKLALFLPDRSHLRPLAEGDKPVSVKDVLLSPEQDGTIKLSAKDKKEFAWWGVLDTPNKRMKAKADQGMFHVLVLLREVASTFGLNETSYVGCYMSDHDRAANSTVVLKCLESGARAL